MTLKDLKRTAHHYFDILWMYKLHHCGKDISYWRSRQYAWLSRKMDLSKEKCHISRFNRNQCKKVIDICSEEFANNEKLIKFAERVEENKAMVWYNLR